MTITRTGMCLLAFSLVAPGSLGQEPSQNSWMGFGNGASWISSIRTKQPLAPSVAWTIQVGEGRSQIVGAAQTIYAAVGSGAKRDGKPELLTTRVVALRSADGSEKWQHELKSEMYDSQETFGGAKKCPRVTPLVVGNLLLATSFTGQLVCLDRANGQPVWQTDLVKDLGAEPVQFGFTSSPVPDPVHNDRVCILAAGKTGGLFCLRLSDGSTVWKAPCTTFSYATPVLARSGNIPQWVIVSENEVLGIAAGDGRQLWRYELPAKGLTNVPTPLVLDGTRLVISGQGCRGTRGLEVVRKANRWAVTERWFNRSPQFFYTNWVRLSDRIVVGCTDRLLAAFDAVDGRTLGRWRGFADGNILLAGENRVMVLGGRGKLSVLQLKGGTEEGGLELQQQFRIGNGRYWTPLSTIGSKMFVRSDDDLVCIETAAIPDTEAIRNTQSEPQTLAFEQRDEESRPDPVAMILEAFEKKGQQQALALYGEFRSTDLLDEDARIALAEAAADAKLFDLMKLILSDATADYPNSKRITGAADSLIGK